MPRSSLSVSIKRARIRHRWRRASTAVAVGAMTGVTLAAVSGSAAQAASPTTVQVSVTTGGFAPGYGSNGGGRERERRLVSDDGRYVVFEAAGAIVPGHVLARTHIVRRDRHLGTTILISRHSSGAAGNDHSTQPSISADGQTIAFHSSASNLVSGDTNGQSDIFVHHVRTGRTTRASVSNTGQQISVNGGTNIVGPPSISANGRFVGFTSHASGVAPGDSTATQAYLRDLQANTTEVVSRSTTNAVVEVLPDSSVSPSHDGTVVAFASGNSSVVPGDTNGDPDVFVRNRSTNTTQIIPGGADGGGRHALSADGRFVAFQSSSATVVPGDTNNSIDVFVHDRQTSQTTRVSVSSSGAQANGASSMPAISKNGRYVTYRSAATNLVSADTNGRTDVFRHDRETGETTRVSVRSTGAQSTDDAYAAAISGDGQHVYFESYDRNLTPVATGSYRQAHVRDLTGRWPALHARVVALPARVFPQHTHRVATRDIRSGPALAITWRPAPGTKGGVVRQSASVSTNTFTLRSPKRVGRYTVTVTYSGHVVGSRTVVVRKPTVAKPAKAVKKGKRLTLRTKGLTRGTKVNVTFKPLGKTKGKSVKRKAAVNRKGVAKVKVAPRKGRYRVIIRSNGVVLRKAPVRVR